MGDGTTGNRRHGPCDAAAGSNRATHVQVFYQHKDLLFSIAYRMLGSVADAEDMLQETFIRWQSTPTAEIQSPRSFLVTVLSRLCLQQLESARAKREEYIGPWLPEPLFTGSWADPSASQSMQESLSLAFLLLLEKLTPAERAAFLLHEVFDYGHAEVAEMLGKTEANCRQLLRRARQHITDGRPRFDPSPALHKKLLDGFLRASTSGDLEQLVALLADDVVLFTDGGGKANAALNLVEGRDRVARLMMGGFAKFVPMDAVTRCEPINGELAIIYSTPGGRPGCVITFDVANEFIQNIYVVTNPEKLRLLPRTDA